MEEVFVVLLVIFGALGFVGFLACVWYNLSTPERRTEFRRFGRGDSHSEATGKSQADNPKEAARYYKAQRRLDEIEDRRRQERRDKLVKAVKSLFT